MGGSVNMNVTVHLHPSFSRHRHPPPASHFAAGPWLDGESVFNLMQDFNVTMSAGKRGGLRMPAP